MILIIKNIIINFIIIILFSICMFSIENKTIITNTNEYFVGNIKLLTNENTCSPSQLKINVDSDNIGKESYSFGKYNFAYTNFNISTSSSKWKYHFEGANNQVSKDTFIVKASTKKQIFINEETSETNGLYIGMEKSKIPKGKCTFDLVITPIGLNCSSRLKVYIGNGNEICDVEKTKEVIFKAIDLYGNDVTDSNTRFDVYDNIECFGNKTSILNTKIMKYGNFSVKQTINPYNYGLVSGNECVNFLVNETSDNIVGIKNYKIENTEPTIKSVPDNVSLTIIKKNIQTNEYVSGAIFSLFEDSECNIVASDKNGNDFDSYTTNGYIQINNLEKGNLYYIKEITEQKNYKYDKNNCTAISADNYDIEFIYDAEPLGHLNIENTDRDNYPIIYKPTSFALYTNSNCTDPAKDAYNKDLENVYTDDFGISITAFENLLYRKYYIKQLQYPEGYNNTNICQLVEIDNETNTAQIKNYKTDIKIRKILGNDKKTPIIIGTIIIQDEQDKIIDTIDDTNSSKIIDLKTGKYKILFKDNNEKYIGYNDSIEIEVVDNKINLLSIESLNEYNFINENNVVTLDIYNYAKDTTNIKFITKLKDDNKPLENIEYEFYSCNENSDNKINKNVLIKSIKTNEDGEIVLDNILQNQNYCISQNKNEKYEILDTLICFYINDNNKIELINHYPNIQIINDLSFILYSTRKAETISLEKNLDSNTNTYIILISFTFIVIGLHIIKRYYKENYHY